MTISYQPGNTVPIVEKRRDCGTKVKVLKQNFLKICNWTWKRRDNELRDTDAHVELEICNRYTNGIAK
jgi:hypothetical protein